MSDKNNVTPALENYLEAIYLLQKDKDTVKVNDIAQRLKVKMPSVTYNMNKLADRKLIKYKKRSHVELTEEGETLAKSVLSAHEGLFKFLHEVLGVEEALAEEEACKVEHELSRDTMERLTRFTEWVGNVPGELAMRPSAEEVCGPRIDGYPLSDVPLGRRVSVKKIHCAGELRKRLVEMGFNTGAEVEVVRVAPLGDPIEIKIKGFHLSLRLCEAAQIEVGASAPQRELSDANNQQDKKTL
ncbi:MAG TPA: metal-dependent transcriptional regulator [bacterium]|nr:metal-dependent transcriptional regulator [bacterium]